MARPLFLDCDQVLRLHRSMIENYSGLDGTRDMALLRSAIAMSQTAYSGHYLHEGLHAMAAAYLYHIVRNHPFIDGNKRTGVAVALVFLAMNGIEVDADEDGLVTITLSVAEGCAEKDEVAEFFRSRSH